MTHEHLEFDGNNWLHVVTRTPLPNEYASYGRTASISTNANYSHRIRSMREIDIDDLLAIENDTWPAYPWSRKDFSNALNDPLWNCWVLESTIADRSILGYGLQYETKYSASVFHIANICIHPKQRGCGLGRTLLRHMIRYARLLGARLLSLEVHVSNMHAYNLYIKHGFVPTEILDKYYQDESDAYRMELLL